MKNYIHNKTAMITGASSGIGKQLAFDLAQMDVNLVLVSRDIQKLEAIKSIILKNNNTTVEVVAINVQDKDNVKLQMESILKHTSIDILVNNAGLALGLDSIDEGNTEDWDTMIDTNVKGLLYVSKAVIPQMRLLPTAHIVNMGSVAGRTAYPNGNVYCATKSAVHSLGEAMNADLFGTNIKVTTVAPGAVETNFSNTRFKGDENKSNAVYDKYTPLSASDISHATINILNTPTHVNIQYIDIMPTAQRNPYQLDRGE